MPTRAIARSRKTPIGVSSDRLAKLARQHLADRVGVPNRERVESVRFLFARGGHEIEAEDVVLTPKPSRKREHFAEEPVIGLAVDEHEAAAVRERVGQKPNERRRLAGARRPWNCRVLPSVVRREPQLSPFQVVAEINRAGGAPWPAIRRRRVVEVLIRALSAGAAAASPAGLRPSPHRGARRAQAG